MGPIGPLDETGQLVPGARPRGIDLREAHEWHYVDVESFPLLLWAFAQQRHSQLALELVEEYCTPAVQEQIVTPVVRYATRVLLRILAQAPADGGAGDADPTPASAPETRSGTIGQSGRTASAS